jgi:hypothetical protein
MGEDGTLKILRHSGGAAIVPVHYSFDPDKDVVWAYKMKKKSASDSDWDKEMEINFESTVGQPCFENFSMVANVSSKVKYDEDLPLRLACDFNVEPMAWVIAQIHPKDEVHFIDEIYIKSGDTPAACEEFLDRYGDHYGEVYVYGDASGGHRSTQSRNQKSNYDEIRLRLTGRPFKLRMRVPISNPSNVNHVRSFNRRLRDQFGNPKILIHGRRCKNLVLDMLQTVWSSEGRKILKSRKRDDPYFWRGHGADAAMALIYRHWPTRKEVSRMSGDEKKVDKDRRMRKNGKKKRRLIGAFPPRR